MRYDFETVVNRSRSGSVKWNAMRELDHSVPDDIVPLSIGDMELKNAPELVAGLQEYIGSTVLGYTEDTPAYRGAVRDWFRRRHRWDVDSEWIQTFDGVVPAMFCAVQTFTRPGDGVIYMPPVYYPMHHAIVDSGREPVAVPLSLGREGYTMDFDRLATVAADPRTKLVLFCSPHNPVSRMWTEEELRRFGRICINNNVLVLSDEIHMDFAMTGHKHTVFTQVEPDFASHAIICTAPSKTFNIAGLQASNIIIPDPELRGQFNKTYENTGRYGINQLGLAACRIAYEHCEPWLDTVLQLIGDNGQKVKLFMREHYPEVRVLPHESTYFLWCDFREWGLDHHRLESFMIKKARLFLDEGYIFGEGGSGFERFNLACPAHVLDNALNRLLAAGRP